MRFTRHAAERMKDRRICQDDVEMAIFYGQRFAQQQVVVFILADHCGDYPAPLPPRLRGLVVIAGCDGAVITTYRCRRGNLSERFQKTSRISLPACCR
jgi:hypothetical protein